MSYYVTHENSVLNINNAHLKVSGNVMTDVLKLGAMEFAPPASDVPGTVNFTNVTTGVTTTSNLNVGGTLMLGSVELVTSTSALEQTVNLGNTTSNTVQFTNPTTGLVATGNVEVGRELTVTGNAIVSSNLIVSGNVEVGTENLFVDIVNSRAGVGTTSPQNMLHVYKANNDETSGIFIEKASGSIPTAAALFFGVASTTETNNNGIPKAAIFYERNLVNGRGDLKFCNDAIDDTNPVSTAASDTRMIIKNSGEIGIGTVSPSTALDVNGTIYGSGTTIQVRDRYMTSNWTTTSATTVGDIAQSLETDVKWNITPIKTSSRIRVDFKFCAYFANANGSNNGVRCQIWRKIGSTYTRVYGIAGANHDLHYYSTIRDHHVYIPISFVDSPGTTSVVEYALRAQLYTTPGTLYIGNASNQPITIQLTEIGA